MGHEQGWGYWGLSYGHHSVKKRLIDLNAKHVIDNHIIANQIESLSLCHYRRTMDQMH
jgi:hypothetical protein